MNIFFKELKSHRKSLIIWSVALVLYVAMAMIKYDATVSVGDSMTALIEAMPKVFQSMLGLGFFDLNTPIGFFAATFTYIMLLGAIHGSMLGANILSAEERDKTTEFLMVKPVTRNKVVLAKMCASLVIIFIFNIVVSIASISIVNSYGKGGETFTGDVLALMVGFLVIELIFFFIGFFLSTILRRSRFAPSLVTTILLTTFLLSVLADMFDAVNWFKYLSPFSYFDPKVLLGFVDPNPVQIGIGILSIIVLGSLSFVFYNKRDLEI
jgi:ABC-2 type transport system permease protein